MSAEVKQAVLDYFASKSKTKTKFYMNDLRKVAPEGMSNREFKKVISEMINAGTLMYFSTGSQGSLDFRTTFDAMATGGVRFARAYVPAPVCSASR